jgi:hypothetical protein
MLTQVGAPYAGVAWSIGYTRALLQRAETGFSSSSSSTTDSSFSYG